MQHYKHIKQKYCFVFSRLSSTLSCRIWMNMNILMNRRQKTNNLYSTHGARRWCNMAADTAKKCKNIHSMLGQPTGKYYRMNIYTAHHCVVCAAETVNAAEISLGWNLPQQTGRQWPCLKAKSWRSLLSWSPAQSHLCCTKIDSKAASFECDGETSTAGVRCDSPAAQGESFDE